MKFISTHSLKSDHIKGLLHILSLSIFQQQTSSFVQSSIHLSLRGEDYVLSAWSLLPVSIWLKPIRDEMVPIRPTSQLGNRPAHRKPGGIQWMALLRSAMPLRTERSSPRICLWSWERLQEENTLVYHVLLHHITMSQSTTNLLYISCKRNCGYNTCGPLRHSHISSASSSVTSEFGVIWRAKDSHDTSTLTVFGGHLLHIQVWQLLQST